MKILTPQNKVSLSLAYNLFTVKGEDNALLYPSHYLHSCATCGILYKTN